ncbi:MAG TPA: ABC transporter ATP-binding protein [Bacteroidia bacterium]|jgi:lipopolysaccharide transport system ATP-binding protein|nr:ABC transporter ATP-binding protein [Bacteroidia bacterium]
MSKAIITVEHLSKSYTLKHQHTERYTALRDVLTNKVKKLVQPKLPKQHNKETFLALNDVSFQIQEGDRVGIIGRNGAGKSTLLKILSRIVTPTKGRITIEGRVASLLEVGTGFHPELTGRENIFLNGSILGMSKEEIKKKFDEIVSFSEVERFLDTPVKRYSSGMYVRLAFSVAAHLDPEILIVDEVLAVGDAAFQKKCLGKMDDVSKTGRTILFVSHNMQMIQKLCNKGILLSKGTLLDFGAIENITKKYLTTGNLNDSLIEFDQDENTSGQPLTLRIENLNGELVNEIPVGQAFQVRVLFKIHKPVEHFIIALGLKNLSDIPIRTSYSSPCNLEEGIYEAVYKYDDVMLASGTYPIVIGLSSYEQSFYYKENSTAVEISQISELISDSRIVRNTGVGFILNPMNISIQKK